LWLAPEQVVVLNITDAQASYAQDVVSVLKKQGLRATADLRNEKINRKIRDHVLQKVPYIVVVGDKERDERTVAVRARGNEQQGTMPLDEFVSKLLTEVQAKA